MCPQINADNNEDITNTTPSARNDTSSSSAAHSGNVVLAAPGLAPGTKDGSGSADLALRAIRDSRG